MRRRPDAGKPPRRSILMPAQYTAALLWLKSHRRQNCAQSAPDVEDFAVRRLSLGARLGTMPAEGCC